MLLLKAANTLFPGQISYPSVIYHELVFCRISKLNASISYTYAQPFLKIQHFKDLFKGTFYYFLLNQPKEEAAEERGTV